MAVALASSDLPPHRAAPRCRSRRLNLFGGDSSGSFVSLNYVRQDSPSLEAASAVVVLLRDSLVPMS
jgi:hypothetical protein